jgi:hypothetical protein
MTDNNHPLEPEYVDEEERVIQSTSGAATEMTIAPKKFEGLQFFAPDEIPDLTDEGVTVGTSLSPQYYEGFVNAGDVVRAIYNGLTVTKSRKNVRPGDPAKEIETVVFQNKDGVFLHSGANLVSQLRGYPQGKPIQITYLGKERTGNGNEINKFEVRVLNITPF